MQSFAPNVVADSWLTGEKLEFESVGPPGHARKAEIEPFLQTEEWTLPFKIVQWMNRPTMQARKSINRSEVPLACLEHSTMHRAFALPRPCPASWLQTLKCSGWRLFQREASSLFPAVADLCMQSRFTSDQYCTCMQPSLSHCSLPPILPSITGHGGRGHHYFDAPQEASGSVISSLLWKLLGRSRRSPALQICELRRELKYSR